MELFGKYWGCHQMPERSYFFKGYQLPVCARCEGMIFGEITALVFVLIGYRMKIYYCLLLLIPMVLDGTLQYKTSYFSTNIKRLLTGIMFGFGLINLIFSFIKLILPG